MFGFFRRKVSTKDKGANVSKTTVASSPAKTPPATTGISQIPSSSSASSVSSQSSANSQKPAPTPAPVSAPASAPTVTVVAGARRDTPLKSAVALTQKDPTTWTTNEVVAWLEFIELGEYAKQFTDNAIAGGDLYDLEEEDLISINVKKLGHRKKILAKIKQLKAVGGFTATTDYGDDVHSTISSESDASSLGAGVYVLKCTFEGEVTVFKVKSDVTLEDVKRKLKKEWPGKQLEIKFIDKDGDSISIRKEDHLQIALKQHKDGTVKLAISEKKTVLGATQTSVLENLVDGVVIIEPRGNILFFNKAAEALFGYARAEVLNKNVSMLMPREVGDVHDGYLKRYLSTGEAHIIGLGRNVTAKRKNGTTFPAHLTLSECKNSKQHTFTGTIRDRSNDADLNTNTGTGALVLDTKVQFMVLDNILDAAIVIDSKGIIQFFNRKALELFGYSQTEVVGKNVKILMPAQYADAHDGYIARYVSTGQGKIIGSTRDVVAMKKDQTFMPITLSVTEQMFNDGRKLFTGILRLIEERVAQEKTVLQQEREVLENLVVPAVIIDERGSIQAMNDAAQKLFGYSLVEVVGKNVKMLMTASDAAHHDTYLANYLRTNKSKVLGLGRDVIAQKKGGAFIHTRLSVTERRDGDKRFFTGIIQAS